MLLCCYFHSLMPSAPIMRKPIVPIIEKTSLVTSQLTSEILKQISTQSPTFNAALTGKLGARREIYPRSANFCMISSALSPSTTEQRLVFLLQTQVILMEIFAVFLFTNPSELKAYPSTFGAKQSGILTLESLKRIPLI